MLPERREGMDGYFEYMDLIHEIQEKEYPEHAFPSTISFENYDEINAWYKEIELLIQAN